MIWSVKEFVSDTRLQRKALTALDMQEDKNDATTVECI